MVLAPASVYIIEASLADAFVLATQALLQEIIGSVSPLLVIPMFRRLGLQLMTGMLAGVCLSVAVFFPLLAQRVKSRQAAT